MIKKSVSKLFLSASQQERKKADQQCRHDIVVKPTPDKMLEWLESVENGDVLVVKYPQELTKARVGTYRRDFTDGLQYPLPRPPGAGRFRKLMERMLRDLVDVPTEGREAYELLVAMLAERVVKEQGVVRADTWLIQLHALNDALELHRQAEQDLKGVDLAETPTGRRPKLSGGTTRSKSVDRKPVVLVRRGASFGKLPARRVRVPSAERQAPLSMAKSPGARTSPEKPKDETSE